MGNSSIDTKNVLGGRAERGKVTRSILNGQLGTYLTLTTTPSLAAPLPTGALQLGRRPTGSIRAGRRNLKPGTWRQLVRPHSPPNMGNYT